MFKCMSYCKKNLFNFAKCNDTIITAIHCVFFFSLTPVFFFFMYIPSVLPPARRAVRGAGVG